MPDAGPVNHILSAIWSLGISLPATFHLAPRSITNEEQIREIIQGSPLAGQVDDIMRLARPAVKMNAYLVESGDLPKGTSRLGGTPDLLAGMPWRQNRGRPIEFLVQVNLADAMRAYAIPGMPSAGWILLFHDFEASFEGAYDEPGLRQFMHFDGPADALQRVEQPVEPAADLNFCELQFEQELCLPGDFYERFPSADDVDEVWEFFDETLWDIGGGPYHRLGGFPMLIQTQERDYPGSEFLMQIDSDDELGWMWGDAGRVYCWTQRKPLLARVVDRLRGGPRSYWSERRFICGDECY